MSLLHAFEGVFSLLLVVGLGYGLASAGWFAEPTRKFIPRFVTNVSLPPFLACTIIKSLQRDDLLHMLYGTVVPFVGMSILFVLAYAAGKLLKVKKRHFGLFCACVSNPNTVFIGIPVNMALFGEEALPYVLLFYFASTIFFWTVGNYWVSRDAKNPDKTLEVRHSRWSSIISPPIMGFVTGLLVIATGVKIPDSIMLAANITGQVTMPLALIFIGITLHDMGLATLLPNKDIMAAIVGRMIVSPLVFMLILPFFHLPELMGKVFIIQSSLPVIMQIAILSAYYNTDPEFGSIMVSLSTILCVVTVPILMVLL